MPAVPAAESRCRVWWCFVKTVRKELIQFLHPQVNRGAFGDGRKSGGAARSSVRSINVFMVAYIAIVFIVGIFSRRLTEKTR